jgi:hypothetical protein
LRRLTLGSRPVSVRCRRCSRWTGTRLQASCEQALLVAQFVYFSVGPYISTVHRWFVFLFTRTLWGISPISAAGVYWWPLFSLNETRAAHVPEKKRMKRITTYKAGFFQIKEHNVNFRPTPFRNA